MKCSHRIDLSLNILFSIIPHWSFGGVRPISFFTGTMHVRKTMDQMSVTELETRIQSMLRNTIRNGIGTVRLAEHLNNRLRAAGLPQRDTNLSIVVDTGKQCIIAGAGKIFEEFKKSGILKYFTGWGMKPALSQDSHFGEALLRLMNFADTYGNEKYKENIVYLPAVDDIPDNEAPEALPLNREEQSSENAPPQPSSKQLQSSKKTSCIKTALAKTAEPDVVAKRKCKVVKRKITSSHGSTDQAVQPDSDSDSEVFEHPNIKMHKSQQNITPKSSPSQTTAALHKAKMLLKKRKITVATSQIPDMQTHSTIHGQNDKFQDDVDSNGPPDIDTGNINVPNPQLSCIQSTLQGNQNDLIRNMFEATTGGEYKDFPQISLEDGMSLDNELSLCQTSPDEPAHVMDQTMEDFQRTATTSNPDSYFF